MYNFGSFDAFIVKPTIMPDFARNLLHYILITVFQYYMTSSCHSRLTANENGSRHNPIHRPQNMTVPRVENEHKHRCQMSVV